MDATVVISASTALIGAVLGSLGAPLLQRRLAVRVRLQEERMALYSEAMLHVHFITRDLEWLVDPEGTPGTTKVEIEQRNALKKVPDQITARMRLIGHRRVRDAWLELLDAREGLYFAIGEDLPGFHQSGSNPREALPTDYRPVADLRAASERFERTCREALHVTD